MKPTILFISHVIPFPPSAGNEIRILKMIQCLKRAGYGIVYLLNASRLDSDSRRTLEEVVGPVYLVGDDYKGALKPLHAKKGYAALLKEKLAGIADRLLSKTERQKKIKSDTVKKSLAPDRLIQLTGFLCEKYEPCAVIAEYIFTTPCLEVVPSGVLKIVDTVDMFSRKKEQVLSYGIEDPLPCTRSEERNYLLKSNIVIAIQSNEARMFRELVPEREVITVGVDFDIVSEVDNSAVIPGAILVVGSDNPLNLHGLNEFYKKAWPMIRSANPGAVLKVIGKLSRHLPTDDERVQRVGWVENLDAEYRKASVVINPTVAGTGLKIKSVEALCRGKALVGTPNSIEGLDFTGAPPFVVCENWEKFSNAVLSLLDSEDKRLKLQETALKFARENFNTEIIYAPLVNVLRSFCTSQHQNRRRIATNEYNDPTFKTE